MRTLDRPTTVAPERDAKTDPPDGIARRVSEGSRGDPVSRLPGILWQSLRGSRDLLIAVVTCVGIGVHLALRFGKIVDPAARPIPLMIVLAIGGVPLLVELGVKLSRRQFASDLLAGISIVTSCLLGEYLAGALVVLVLSGGQALEGFAVRSASSVLRAPAKRVPSVAHRRTEAGVTDVPLERIAIGDTLLLFPHEIGHVDRVTEGYVSTETLKPII